MLLPRLFLPVVFCTVLGCGGVVSAQAPDVDGAAPDAPSTLDAHVTVDARAADVEVFDARDPVTCAGGGTLTYDKACTTDAECVVVTLYLGCCHGAALGCNASGAADLADAGAACSLKDPCDCAGDVVTADDGRVSRAPGHTDVTVACTRGLCLSRVR